MGVYTLHARQRRLLYLLNCRHEVITGKELSAKMGVSERTIRSDIVEINRMLEEHRIRILAVRGKGYLLQVKDRTVLHELLSEKDNIQTREDRIRYLIVNLVYSSEWVDLRELEDDMFVSRTTLENDLKDIRNRISQNQPFLPLRRNGNFILLEEDEIKKRNILIRVYSENWDYNSQDGIFLKENVVTQELLNQIRHILKQVLREQGIELDDFGLIYLILAFAVSYSRIAGGHKLQSFAGTCQETKYAQAAKKMWDSLQVLWKLPLNQNEYDWITETLEKLAILHFGNHSMQEVCRQTDPQCAQLAQKLIAEIHADYGLDFTEDEEFFARLLLHIQALKNGMISIQTQGKYIMEELRLEYPCMGDISHYICLRLRELCGRELGEEEEDYLLPLLVLARNRLMQTKSHGKVRAAVVSHLNAALTDYFMAGLESCTGGIALAGPFPIYDRAKIDEANPAFVITTVKMDNFRSFDVPVIVVSPLLEEEDQRRIRRCRKELEEMYLYPQLPCHRETYFRKELLVGIERRVSIEEALGILEENLRSSLYLDEEVRIDWKQCYGTVLKNGVLFIHALGNRAQKTVLSIGICKHMLVWKQARSIRKIIVMILNEQERKYIGSFYQMVKEYANDWVEE